MATLSKAFTATGFGTSLGVRHQEQITYSVTGTFVGTLVLQKSEDMTNWSPVATTTTTVSATTITAESKARSMTFYRWACTAYTSGTATGVLTEVTTEAAKSFADQDGDIRLEITEEGVKITGTQETTGAQTFDGNVTVTGTLTSPLITSGADVDISPTNALTGSVVDEIAFTAGDYIQFSTTSGDVTIALPGSSGWGT